MIPPDRTHKAPELPRWQQQELAARLAEVERDPGVLLPADEVEAELQALLSPPNPV